eukprot:TRINITY_DN5555_c0_g1_i2.p1 TRINITY_DN5555_c0_g1~~TRINITY_DN5555_c0_g1_i2.p1  ORF type:complete len:411 (-),score=52.62 TRINITY_DN5555_c0_g1_i2:88-1320(-)
MNMIKWILFLSACIIAMSELQSPGSSCLIPIGSSYVCGQIKGVLSCNLLPNSQSVNTTCEEGPPLLGQLGSCCQPNNECVIASEILCQATLGYTGGLAYWKEFEDDQTECNCDQHFSSCTLPSNCTDLALDECQGLTSLPTGTIVNCTDNLYDQTECELLGGCYSEKACFSGECLYFDHQFIQDDDFGACCGVDGRSVCNEIPRWFCKETGIFYPNQTCSESECSHPETLYPPYPVVEDTYTGRCCLDGDICSLIDSTDDNATCLGEYQVGYGCDGGYGCHMHGSCILGDICGHQPEEFCLSNGGTWLLGGMCNRYYTESKACYYTLSNRCSEESLAICNFLNGEYTDEQFCSLTPNNYGCCKYHENGLNRYSNQCEFRYDFHQCVDCDGNLIDGVNISECGKFQCVSYM